MFIYTPYVYLIGWSALDRYYIGSRYKKDVAHPSDLWTSYFTSSPIVDRYREQHGEPDIIMIRNTFTDGDKALAYESKILQRLKARSHPKLINENENNGSNWGCIQGGSPVKNTKWIHNIETGRCRRIDSDVSIPKGWQSGRPKTKFIHNPKTNEFRRIPIDYEVPIGWEAGHHVSGKRWIHNPETNDQRRLPNKDPIPDGWKAGQSPTHCLLRRGNSYNKDKRWIHNPETNDQHMIHRDDDIPVGWLLGRPYGKQTTATQQ